VGQYAATKHALKAIADCLREEVNPKGVRVLTVYLGRTATAMQEAVHRQEGRVYRPETLLQPEDVATMVVQALMLPYTAEVTDISIRPMVKHKCGAPNEPGKSLKTQIVREMMWVNSTRQIVGNAAGNKREDSAPAWKTP
jgi:short-subunit dehydrogenase